MHAAARETIQEVPSYSLVLYPPERGEGAAEEPDEQAAAQTEAAGAESDGDHEPEQDGFAEPLSRNLPDREHGERRRHGRAQEHEAAVAATVDQAAGTRSRHRRPSVTNGSNGAA